MKLLLNTNLFSLVAIALTFSFLTSCGTDGDHDDHDEVPVGLALTIGDDEVATQVESTVTYANSSYANGEELVLTQGATLSPISVTFISEDGDRFSPHSDEGYSLQYSADDDNVVTLAPVSGDDEWTFQLTGNMAKVTTINFELLHNGHSDFVSQPFNVRVINVQSE